MTDLNYASLHKLKIISEKQPVFEVKVAIMKKVVTVRRALVRDN